MRLSRSLTSCCLFIDETRQMIFVPNRPLYPFEKTCIRPNSGRSLFERWSDIMAGLATAGRRKPRGWSNRNGVSTSMGTCLSIGIRHCTANFCWHCFLPLQRRGTEIVLEVVNDIANAGSCRDASRVPLWQVQWLGKRPELARPEVPPMWCWNPDGSVGPRKAQNDQLIVLGKFDHDLTESDRPLGIMVDKGNHPQINGPTIQVSEIL